MTSAGTLQTITQSARSDDPAIAAPERTPLTYAGLRGLTDQTVAALNQIGVGRGDRVAIVLPNGPEMATAFLTIGSGATTAPLNPGYHAEEFDFTCPISTHEPWSSSKAWPVPPAMSPRLATSRL